MTPARTIEEALREAAASLRDAGIERPRVDAELLLTHLLGVRRVDLLMRARDPLPPENEAAFADWVRRRAARCPLPYLIGEREFMGLRFLVDEHVLIPRPETEVLVEAALGCVGVWGCGSVGVWECRSVEERPAVGSGSPVSGPSPTPPHSHTPILLVDVGTGSGAIAVSLAHFAPEARVLATDVSPEACAVARENARRLGVAERVEVLEGDLLEPVVRRLGEMGADARADVVCANLPYVPAESLPGLQPEVRDWEPRPALDGGPGGLDLVERLLAQVPVVLRPGGSLLLEIGPEAGQPERLTALLDVSGLYYDVRVLPDLAGLPRVVVGRAKSGKRKAKSGRPRA